MPLNLPSQLAEKAAHLPESAYGVNTVDLVLRDGRRICGIRLAWGSEIVKIGDKPVTEKHELGFQIEDIVDLAPESHVNR